MSIIKTLHYEYYEDFICEVEDKYYRLKEKDDYNSIDIIAKYDDAKEIIQELVCAGYGIVNIDELTEPSWNDYDDAFVISLFEGGIWCEPVKRNDEYIFVEADVVYIFSDCNSRIIDKIEADEVYEVDSNEDDCDCKNCNCCNINTVSSSATYKINGKSVDRDVFIDRFTEAIDSFVKWQNVSSKLFEELFK